MINVRAITVSTLLTVCSSSFLFYAAISSWIPFYSETSRAESSTASHPTTVPDEVTATPLLKEENTIHAFFEKVRQFTLDNGVRVIMYRRGEAPIFAGAVTVRVGSTDEPTGFSGISHLVEHMAFKGTPEIGTSDYSKERRLLTKVEEIAAQSKGGTALSESQKKEWDSLQQQLENLWKTEEFSQQYEIQGSNGLNAETSAELTQYFVSLPRASFEFWLQRESGRLLEPVLRQFYQERDVVLEERRMNWDDRPQGKMWERLISTAFIRHPYRNPLIGYPDEVGSFTATQLKEFMKQFYVAGNIVVTLVGDVDPDRDRPLIEQYFGQLPKAVAPTRIIPTEPPQDGERSTTVLAPSEPEIWVAYRRVAFADPDSAALSLMGDILAGSNVSPLFEQLVKKDRVATAVDYGEGPGTAYPNLLMFTMSTRSGHSNDEVLKDFDRTIERFKAAGPSEHEVDVSKRRLTVNFLQGLDKNMSLAKSLASAELLYGDWHEMDRWYQSLSKVTPEEVKRVAQRYLRAKYRTIVRLERES